MELLAAWISKELGNGALELEASETHVGYFWADLARFASVGVS